MNAIKSSEFKVGVLVVVVFSIIAFMSMKVSKSESGFSSNKEIIVDLEDAGGLIKNSAVKMAGIKVGIIKDIRLVDGKARVYLSINDDVPLTQSAIIELRSDGILGDKHVELVNGDVKDAPAAEGHKITSVINRGSMDQVMKDIGNISQSLAKLATVLNNAAEKGDSSTPIGRIILNIEKLTTDLSLITESNKDHLNSIIERVDSITASLDNFVSSDESGGLKASFATLTESINRAERALENIEDITGKINDGEGTIGRLVNDDYTVDELNKAITNVNDFIGGAGDLRTAIDYHTEYMTRGDFWKSYLNFKIQPGLDRHYEIGIISDPRGVVKTTQNEVVTDGVGPTVVRDKETKFQDLKFNAVFAKHFYNLTVRGGLIESSAGIAFDYYFYHKKFSLSAEFFDLADRQIRILSKFDIFSGLYLVAGAEDLMENRGPYNIFLGGGILLDNDDLKMFASKLSF